MVVGVSGKSFSNNFCFSPRTLPNGTVLYTSLQFTFLFHQAIGAAFLAVKAINIAQNMPWLV